jgi:hypothetical protein
MVRLVPFVRPAFLAQIAPMFWMRLSTGNEFAFRGVQSVRRRLGGSRFLPDDGLIHRSKVDQSGREDAKQVFRMEHSSSSR